MTCAETNKLKTYSTKTVKQLSTEFVVTTNAAGKAILLDISGFIPTPSTESHLLTRAAILEGSCLHASWGTQRPVANLITKLPHIKCTHYDPSSDEVLQRLATGFFNLNTYRKALGVEGAPFMDAAQCPAMFGEYMERMFKNPDERGFMMRWMARGAAQPAFKMRVAPILRGEPGVGKGVLVDIVMSKLLGKHNVLNTKLSDVTGNFNAPISRCTLCCLDETYCQKKSSADKLKKLVTDDFLTVTEKHKDSVQQQIYANVIILSNDEFPIHIESGDRRYYVPEFIKHKVGKVETKDFIGRFIDWFESGGVCEVYKHLMHVDAVNVQNHDGFMVAEDTASHASIKTPCLKEERIGELIDYVEHLSVVSIPALKDRFPFVPVPAIAKTLRQLGYVKKTLPNERGGKGRKWVRQSLQSKSVTRLASSTNDPDFLDAPCLDQLLGGE